MKTIEEKQKLRQEWKEQQILDETFEEWAKHEDT